MSEKINIITINNDYITILKKLVRHGEFSYCTGCTFHKLDDIDEGTMFQTKRNNNNLYMKLRSLDEEKILCFNISSFNMVKLNKNRKIYKVINVIMTYHN